MAVPKKRRSKTRQGLHRAHLAIKKQNLSSCAKCGEPIIPHRVCLTCGTYKNDQVIDFSKRDKKEKEVAKKKK